MNRWIVSLVLMAVIGLTVVQVNYVRLGFRLEQRQFEQRLDQTLLDFRSALDRPGMLSTQMMALFEDPASFFVVKRDSLFEQNMGHIRQFVQNRLRENGIDVAVSFAITGTHHNPIYLVSELYDAGTFRFDQHFIALEGRLETACECTLFLHLYSGELTSYVMRRLAYLIWPSVLFILVIISCLALLMFTLHKQRRLNQVKNDFINNLTHELKTPVFSISLATKMLREKFGNGKSGDAGDFVNIIDKENEKLKVHIDRVLELASLEDGARHLHKTSVELNHLIRQLVSNNQLNIRALNGELHFHESEKGICARLDADHFKNVLQNLIDNAIKYSDTKPVIQIELFRRQEHIGISIADRGVGIAPSHQQQIFDKFYRVPTGDLHQVKGFGLGLSYVRQIVEAHGGTIRVESKPRAGSRFTILFPE